MTSVDRSGVACAILAAGASRRLGQPKQLLAVADQPLVRRIAETALASRAATVAVVLGAHADLIAPALAGLTSVEILRIADWSQGMSAAVRAAAAWAQAGGWPALLLTVTDQVRLDADHLNALIDAADGGQRVVASLYGGLRGVPAVLPSGHYPRLRQLTGDRGARALLRAVDTPVVEIPWPAGAIDVDEPGDLPERSGSRLR